MDHSKLFDLNMDVWHELLAFWNLHDFVIFETCCRSSSKVSSAFHQAYRDQLDVTLKGEVSVTRDIDALANMLKWFQDHEKIRIDSFANMLRDSNNTLSQQITNIMIEKAPSLIITFWKGLELCRLQSNNSLHSLCLEELPKNCPTFKIPSKIKKLWINFDITPSCLLENMCSFSALSELKLRVSEISDTLMIDTLKAVMATLQELALYCFRMKPLFTRFDTSNVLYPRLTKLTCDWTFAKPYILPFAPALTNVSFSHCSRSYDFTPWAYSSLITTVELTELGNFGFDRIEHCFPNARDVSVEWCEAIASQTYRNPNLTRLDISRERKDLVPLLREVTAHSVNLTELSLSLRVIVTHFDVPCIDPVWLSALNDLIEKAPLKRFILMGGVLVSMYHLPCLLKLRDLERFECKSNIFCSENMLAKILIANPRVRKLAVECKIEEDVPEFYNIIEQHCYKTIEELSVKVVPAQHPWLGASMQLPMQDYQQSLYKLLASCKKVRKVRLPNSSRSLEALFSAHKRNAAFRHVQLFAYSINW